MPTTKPIAITMGDPAGISGEITLKTWCRVKDRGVPFVALDNVERLQNLSTKLNIKLPIIPVGTPLDAVHIFQDALPVYDIHLAQPSKLGYLDQRNAKSIIKSIEIAASFATNGLVSAVVTNPIHKKSLYKAGFPHLGHTEYLAALSGESIEPAMMLACQSLRTVPVTTHLSLKQAIFKLSIEKIVSQSHITATALSRDFGVKTPRLAIAGLNPHAGEEGTMGEEEEQIIKPAIKVLLSHGISVIGPMPPDTMFSEANRETYDAAICMYHDQALIPIKTLDFSSSVNITLGLPFVRTSPDHGTALEIANKGIADETSIVAALFMAAEIAQNRGV